MARDKKKPQHGRAKTNRKQNGKPWQKRQPQLNTNSSVALTIPSPGWTEWMQNSLDSLAQWIFPQPESYIFNDIDMMYTDTDTDIIDSNTTQAIPLTELDGTNGIIINGAAPWKNYGVMIAGGDANGDGYDDVGIGSPFVGAAGIFDLVAGGPNLQSPIPLSAPNAAVFSATGQEQGDFFGSAVAIDNEGVVVSARYASRGNKTSAGITYDIPGNATGQVDLSAPEVRQFIGIDTDEQSGSALAIGRRMVEGVMKRFIIITAPFACPESNCDSLAAGRIYGIYDDPNLPNPYDLSRLYDPSYNANGSEGFVIEGIPGEQAGCGVTYIEKLDALLIGAAVASPNNKTYAGTGYLLYLNSLFSSSSVFSLLDINEANGKVFYGPRARAKFATGVGFAEGFFGNGNDALIFGAPGGCPDVFRRKAGMVFAVNLVPDLPYSVDLSNQTVVSEYAVQFNGVSAADNAGIAVNGAGNSIIIAAVTGSLARADEPGLTYVVNSDEFSAFPKPFELSSLNGTQGNQYIGGQPNSTWLIDSQCVSAADVDGNGFVDWIISQYSATPNANLTGAGQIYVVYRYADVPQQSYSAQACQYLSSIHFESVCQATVNGASRGASRVIEQNLGQYYNSTVSKSVSELIYTLSYAAFNYWHHYNRAVAEGDELGAPYKAVAETYNDMLIWIGARVFFEGVIAKSFDWAADHARDRGYSSAAGWLSFFGNNASTMAYLQSAITREGVPGILNAACTLFSGGLAEKGAMKLGHLLSKKKLDEGIIHEVGFER